MRNRMTWLVGCVVLGWCVAPPGASAEAKGGAAAEPMANPAGIEWRHDDYAAARSEARTRGRRLVVDLWAPWCHTCLSMKQTVLRDPALAPYAERFVWLALDTDRPANAAAVAKFPPAVWPTFYVIDPETEAVEARLLGAAGVTQFAAFLDGAGQGTVRAADRLAAAGEHGAAEGAYAKVLAAGLDRARRPALWVSRINAAYRSDDTPRCLAVAEAGLVEVGDGHTPAAADFVYYVNACVQRAGLDARGRRLLEGGLRVIDAALDAPGAPLTVDDRSEALRIAREVHATLGDPAAARRRALTQRALLDGAAAAVDARTAMTWNWPRAEVYAFLGEPAALVPALEASTRALPGEYDPPHRLAWVRLKAGDAEGARAAATQALARVYGPRTVRVWQLLAEIEAARGDRAAERAALAGVLSALEEHRPDDAAAIAEARAALAAHDAASAGGEDR